MRADRSLQDGVVVRPACEADGPTLARIDTATHSSEVSPGPLPQPAAEFFGAGNGSDQILVAEVGGVPVGYVKIAPDTPGWRAPSTSTGSSAWRSRLSLSVAVWGGGW